MKTLARSACVAVLVLLLATASPAVAKGPTDVAVVGPGINTGLTWTERDGDVDMGTLGEAARIHELWQGNDLAAGPPLTADELGPRFVLTWTVAGMEWAVQHAYPFAEGGAWVRHFPGDGKAGWARTPALRKALVELGAVAEAPAPVVSTVEPAATPAAAEDSGPAARTSYDVALPAGLALAVLLVAGLLMVRRRRLSR